ncbi:MAG: DUF3109 family protein [Catalinimonas sp.]
MIVLDKTLVSDDVSDQFFVCHLEACKGACCVEGDLGAPLEADELPVLENIWEAVAPYLSDAGRAAVEKQGPWVLDDDGDYSTPTVGGRECAYAVYDERGVLKCGIEQAHRDGKIDFKKPISCHLYPIRTSRYDDFEVLNYDRWHICDPACGHGAALGVPIYKFLKEPLVRKYGAAWYGRLVELIENTDARPNTVRIS